MDQITWQKLSGYWGGTIRLPDRNYRWRLYLTGHMNTHLITRLKEIVLMLSSVAEVLAFPCADMLNEDSHLRCMPDIQICLNSGNALL